MFEGLHDGPSLRGFGDDAVHFNAIASNLVQHHEYAVEPGRPTSYRAPGFPFALAAVYEMFGADYYPAARVFFCLVGALLTVSTFFLAREMTDRVTALLAAALVAIYPNLLYYSIHFASEPLYTLLLVTSVWAFLRALERRSFGYYCASGFLFGAAALTRPVALVFPLLFGVAALILARHRLKQTLIGVGLCAGVFVLTLAPWAARNYLVLERFVPVAANGGEAFWGSNNQIVLTDSQYRGGWVGIVQMTEQKKMVRELANEVDRDRLEMQYGKQFIRQNLKAVPRLFWNKLCAFWTPVPASPTRMSRLIIALSYGPLLPLMIAGGWLFLKQRPATHRVILLLPIMATVLTALVYYGSTRFRSPIEPFLLILAATAIVRLWRTSRTRGKEG